MILSLFAASIALNPYGACAHITGHEYPVAQKTCEMMRQAGMGWVRCDFHWHSVEKKKGAWDFSRFDGVVSECEAAGLQLLPILCYSVPWANPAYRHLDSWEEYVRRVVSRYGRRLPVVEVWNEANLEQFWRNPNPTNYLALLRRTYETVKKVDPGIRVAFGGTSGVPFGFIEEVYRLGGGKCFDIMNIHPYSHPNRPEGFMDANMEKLRELMAKYGDGDKPVWITEVGWPTHRVVPADGGLLRAGLKAARPEAKWWRMLYVPAQNDADGDGDKNVCAQLVDILPEGSSAEVCRADNLARRLAQGDVDAVVYPFSENYAADSVDAVYEFVKAGGVLVDFGGMPMWNAYRMGADGAMHQDKNAKTANDRRRLRISEMAWWMDKRYPKSLQVHPSSSAKGLALPPKGFAGERFLTSRLLKPGDEFIPLLSASTNGVEAVAAVVYRFGSDMKGAVVVSTIMERGRRGASSYAQQAKFAARSMGIAFAENVEKFFWYEFRQPDRNPNDSESHFGMVYGNFAPKPAYGAYMTFVGVRPAGSEQCRDKWRSDDGKTYFPQWKRPDGRFAGMIWSLAPGRRKVVFSSTDMEFVDLFGARVRPVRNGNAYELALTDSPIYFVGGKIVEIGESSPLSGFATPFPAKKCGHRTKVLFFFDTEDFTSDESNDAIRDIANILHGEGVRGQFAMAGQLGRFLLEKKRTDVIAALKHHLVGSHTLYHSKHPNIAEYGDIEDYDAAYRRTWEEEKLGFELLENALGQRSTWCSVFPGNANSYVGLYVHSKLGSLFFGGNTDSFTFREREAAWFVNQFHLPYYKALHLESFIPPKKMVNLPRALDTLSSREIVTLYMHPHMALFKKHWDSFNFNPRDPVEWGKWRTPPKRDKMDVAIYYDRLRTLVRALVEDPRFEVTDCERLQASFAKRKTISVEKIPAIRRSLLERLGPVESLWCVSDVFQAVVKLLRGEKSHVPGYVYGFLKPPVGVKAAKKVKSAYLKAAAAKIDLSTFIPHEIDVGGTLIGPADFLFAALEFLETGADEINVEPRDQLGPIHQLNPSLATYNMKGGWPLYEDSFEDRYLTARLRLQLWTLRYEPSIKVLKRVRK